MPCLNLCVQKLDFKYNQYNWELGPISMKYRGITDSTSDTISFTLIGLYYTHKFQDLVQCLSVHRIQ